MYDSDPTLRAAATGHGPGSIRFGVAWYGSGWLVRKSSAPLPFLKPQQFRIRGQKVVPHDSTLHIAATPPLTASNGKGEAR